MAEAAGRSGGSRRSAGEVLRAAWGGRAARLAPMRPRGAAAAQGWRRPFPPATGARPSCGALPVLPLAPRGGGPDPAVPQPPGCGAGVDAGRRQCVPAGPCSTAGLRG